MAYPQYGECSAALKLINPNSNVDAVILEKPGMAKEGNMTFCPAHGEAMENRGAGRYGWCKTSNTSEDKWGFCSRSCSIPKKYDQPKQLSVAELYFIGNCERYSPIEDWNQTTEYCMAGKVDSPHVLIYGVQNKSYSSNNNSYIFKSEVNSTFENVGFMGICPGDSGGPNWVMVRDDDEGEQQQRAVLVGVTVRARHFCGLLGAVTVSVSFIAHKKWILARINYSSGFSKTSEAAVPTSRFQNGSSSSSSTTYSSTILYRSSNSGGKLEMMSLCNILLLILQFKELRNFQG